MAQRITGHLAAPAAGFRGGAGCGCVVVAQLGSCGRTAFRTGLGSRTGCVQPGVSRGRNGFGFGGTAARTGVGLYTLGRTTGLGGHFSRVPGVVAQLRIDVAVNGAGTHLAGIRSLHGFVAPGGPGRPLLISKQIFIGGVILLVDRNRPVPNAVRTLGTGGQLIASVGGIVIVSLRGGGGAEEHMEAPVAVGFVRGAGVTAVAAPVIPQVSNQCVRIHHRLIRCGFGCTHFFADIVVSRVSIAAGGESGGPALDVSDFTGAGLLPLAADQGIAIQVGFIGSQGAVILVAVLGLAFHQLIGNTCGLCGGPVGIFACILLIAAAAGGTGILVDGIFCAGCGDSLHSIGMTSGSNSLGVDLTADGTGFFLGTGFGTGSGLGDHIAAVGMAQGFDRTFLRQAALGAVGDLRALCGAGRCFNCNSLIAVRAGALIRGGADNGKIVGFQGTGTGGGAELIFGYGIVAGIGNLNAVGVQSGGQTAEGGGIIDGTVRQNILVVADRAGAAGNRRTGGGCAGVDVNRGSSQGIITGGDGAGNNEGVALHMAIGVGRSGELDIGIHLFAVFRIAGVDVALLTAGGQDLVEDISAGVHIQADGSVGGAVGRGLQLDGGVAGFGGPGLTENTGIPVGCKGAVRRIEGTFVKIGGIRCAAAGAFRDNIKCVGNQLNGARIGGQFLGRRGIIVGIVSTDHIGIGACGQIAEGGGIINGTAGKAVLIVRGCGAATGNGSAAGGIAGIDIDADIPKLVIGGTDVAINDKHVANHVIAGNVITGDSNIGSDLIDILDAAGINVAVISGAGGDTVPQIAAAVDIQAVGNIGGTQRSGFNHIRGTAGFGVKIICGSDLDGAVSGVEGTVLLDVVRLGRLNGVAVKAVLLDDGGVILITNITVIRTVAVDPDTVGKLVHAVLAGIGRAVFPVVTGAVIGTITHCKVMSDPYLVFCADGIHGQLGGEVFAGIHTNKITFRCQHIHGCQAYLLRK